LYSYLYIWVSRGRGIRITVNGKDMKVEKSTESEKGEDIEYPKIVFSDS
jgi:hypothetical protein